MRTVALSPAEPAYWKKKAPNPRIPVRDTAARYQLPLRRALMHQMHTSGKTRMTGPISPRATSSWAGLNKDRVPSCSDITWGGKVNGKLKLK